MSGKRLIDVYGEEEAKKIVRVVGYFGAGFFFLFAVLILMGVAV